MHRAELFRLPKSWHGAACAALLTSFAAPAFAQHEHASSEFEVFVAAEALAGHSQPHPREEDSWVNADVIYGLTHDHFRVFGEYYVTPEEHDLERFQVGYEAVPDTVLWLGRFHQPGSAWDTEHHHGRYLQTSITRPAIENWEDEEGLIPEHITGLLVESRRPLGAESGLQISSGIGAGPAMTHDGNEPITLVGSNPGKHGLALSSRLAYLPDYAGTSSAGLLWGPDQLFEADPLALAALRSNHATLGIYGAYADWSVDAWRITAAGYYVDVELDRPNSDAGFMSGYVQAQRQLAHGLTAYGRAEDSARMQRSRYVALFDDHPRDIEITLRRQVAGLRWDYARRQALSFELGHVVSLTQSANEIRLQWSAAIP
ncbi:MAG: hypothetical protein ACYC9Z_13960 [Casimicrobiaceae bacterium]